MFIQIEQKVKCSKCGSQSFENFSDVTHQGLRCLHCGHEKRELRPHLKHMESDGTASWQKSGEREIEF